MKAGVNELTSRYPNSHAISGTGSLTEGLLRVGCPAERLIVLEREPSLARVLRRAFPAVTVLEDDATRIGDALAERGVTQLAEAASMDSSRKP